MKPNGKNICAALKQVRKRVADTNGITYAPKECHFEGNCNGTCPACEAEVRYLEHQLDLLRKTGKAVTVMGVALGMTLATGCSSASKSCTPIPTVEAPENILGELKYEPPKQLQEKGLHKDSLLDCDSVFVDSIATYEEENALFSNLQEQRKDMSSNT
ncbi:membrane receptor RagA [Prevotella conceptionensis]|uniref:membrane receptor RagA n=1 Tax=Prevotella conceptionensis TaxID=340486 RepID=UPI0002D9AD2A|nr:membrane receptor RagA [Prevotella conceptionensis]